MTGTVKWYNEEKGFGFIVSDEVEKEDIFAHCSKLDEGVNYLVQHQIVEFEVIKTNRGYQAVKIKPVL